MLTPRSAPLEPQPTTNGDPKVSVGNITPGYPRGGPKCTRPDRVGRADEIPADSIRTVRRAKLQEASSGVGIDPIFLVQLEI